MQKRQGLPLDGLPEPGRNGDGEQRPRGHCLVPAGRPLASSSCGEDETVSLEQSETHRSGIFSACAPQVKQRKAAAAEQDAGQQQDRPKAGRHEVAFQPRVQRTVPVREPDRRSEEHTSELQSP